MAASKRPRLSLQTSSAPIRNVRPTKSTLDNGNPKSLTAFNTLSNVYTTAIERSTPIQATPLTAINLSQALIEQSNGDTTKDFHQRISTPYTSYYPDTPLSDHPASPTQPMQIEMKFPSAMTCTPPLSAGPVDPAGPKMFSFAPSDTAGTTAPSSPAPARGRGVRLSVGMGPKTAPYSHPQALHSILRNSPLPPLSTVTPVSPRRQSARLQEKANRHVEYDSPLEQTIITERYIKTHVDLLVDEASPFSASPMVEDSDAMLDLTVAYQGDETLDGGQTPGPFEEMRRRMAGLAAHSPTIGSSGGIRKRKSKEKKRKWVWTIGREEEEVGGATAAPATMNIAVASPPVPILAIPTKTKPALVGVRTPTLAIPTKAATPEPLTAVQISVEPADSEPESQDADVAMSDVSSVASSRATTPYSVDLNELKTPVAAIQAAQCARFERLGSVDSLSAQAPSGTRRDTPIPPDLVAK